ncbi:type III-B CRISPR module RAMP protein Cmr4 [Haliscomenobacter hydrossis]|uniref:CRISPR-associated RAMP protein, Cmr4 family n=1 Tax=Haliscomenobacter hydrossis (strain ATCC 27775 / DSM 1100 / LMG 10767 / O) TaxID=760192 RepID=F4L2K0_HALH1|nr:type III-B CRISPR module RAMP protein Cmr4 [Haliscomenobacter hydrossis]AEE53918.1 CRISPR-associated RAMP protein, Cmr4 family [Haliscomenobacter hydrossis DSM 1100]
MYQVAKPLFLYCETPLHAGTGSELGVVDLPIQRERHSGFPKIEGSSLKGAIRERFEDMIGSRDHADLYAVFGPEGDGTDNYAGAIGFTDARLLLFPVKSMKGVFGWVTCPRVLKRLLQDLSAIGKDGVLGFTEKDLPETPQMGQALVTNTSALLLTPNRIVLEEYAFSIEKDDILTEFSNWLLNHVFEHDTWWQEKIAQSLVLINDEDFRDFVTLSTEVITRTKIDNETGTVQDGALFTEEYLPESSVLYSLILASPVFPGKDQTKKKQLSHKKSFAESDANAVQAYFEDILVNKAQNRLQLGANATLGKGLIRTTLIQ